MGGKGSQWGRSWGAGGGEESRYRRESTAERPAVHERTRALPCHTGRLDTPGSAEGGRWELTPAFPLRVCTGGQCRVRTRRGEVGVCPGEPVPVFPLTLHLQLLTLPWGM